MQTDTQNSQPEQSGELDQVAIDDAVLENEDQQKKLDTKAAKKRAKQLRTPEETKQLKRRRLLIIIGGVLVFLLLLFAIPFTRWPILNALGFRGNLTVLAQDAKSYETITDAEILLDGTLVGTTDASGQLKLADIKLGSHNLEVQKVGYSHYQSHLTLGLKQQQANASLEAIGLKLTVTVKNWLTNEPVPGAVVKSGDRKATADSKGQANIIVPPTDEKVKASVATKGYITREVLLDPNIASRDVVIVPSDKDYFISKRDGKFDIFSSNIDGSEQKKIIAATGNENQNLLQFTVHRANKHAILVATREPERQNNHIVAGVYDVDLENAKLKKIDDGSDIYVIGWAGDTLYYQKTNPKLNYDDKNFAQLVGYNMVSGAQSTVAQANYFQLASIVGQKLFYVPSDAYRSIKSQLTSLDPASGAKQTYLKDVVISYGTQTAYGILQLEDANGKYYEVSALDGSTKPIDHQPGDGVEFALGQNTQTVISAQRRDGKGALIQIPLSTNKEKTVLKLGGLSDPVRFISKRLAVVRVATNQETADYVVDVPTGKFAKIVDVSNVGHGNL